jgi:chromosome segregation ATPase
MYAQSSGVLDQLKELQQQLADLDKDIEGDNTSIQKKRAKRAELQARIAPLAQLGKQVSDSKDALKKERDDGAKLLTDTTAFRDQVLARLKGQLSADIIAKIEHGVQAIDDEIGHAEADVRTSEGAAATAGQERADAQAAVKEADGQRTDTVNALRQLPKAIQGAAADVKRLHKDLDDAAKAGNLPRAYYLALALGAALDRLKAASNDELEKNLLKQLDDQSVALAKAQEAEGKAGDNVQRKEDELKVARDALDTLKKQRQQRVDDLLNGKGGGQAAKAAPAASPQPAMPPPIAGAQSS